MGIVYKQHSGQIWGIREDVCQWLYVQLVSRQKNNPISRVIILLIV